VWRTEERERSGIFSTAAGLLSVYRSQAALDPATRPNFDPDRFAASQDTLYVCAPGHAQELLAPLIVALLDQIRAACYVRRRSHPDSAPTLFLLDEVANIAPLPGLPQLASEGGGQGVVTLACLQDLSQARARWGTMAEGFFSLFGTKVVFPGIADRWTLELVSSLMGDVQVPVQSVSQPVRPPAGLVFLDAMLNKGPSAIDVQRPTVTSSTVFRPRMPVEAIYQGEQGRAFAFGTDGAGYVPVEGWWDLRKGIERRLSVRRQWSSGPVGDDSWPDSRWGTLGPRMVGRDAYGLMVVVPGTRLEPAVRQQVVAVNIESDRTDQPATTEADSADLPDQTAPGQRRAKPDARMTRGFPVLARVMGPPELIGDVETPDREKAVELACILALHGHRAMTSEELRAALWPGELGEPGVGAKSLMNTASILRKALGAEHFPEARRGSGYQLGPGVGCDWVIFSELVSTARGSDEKEQLREALSLVRGCPFQGVKQGTYTWAWTEHLASSIEGGIRKAAYRFCGLSLDDGDHDSAVWAALQALACDPYDQQLWELYLLASAASGRRALDQAWKEAQSILLNDVKDLETTAHRLRANCI